MRARCQRKSPLQSILLEELVNFLASMLRLAGVCLIFETWYSMEKMIETFHESNCKPFFFSGNNNSFHSTLSMFYQKN